MKISTAPQGSDEWWAARLGHPTASQFHRIISPAKAEPSTQARAYKCELIYERLYRQPWERLKKPTQAMQDGIDNEPWAAKQFTLDTGLELQPIGHITDDLVRWGTSPDRIVTGSNEAVEIKCPTAPVHIRYMLHGPDTDYRCQVQGHLMIGGFDKCHFYSYHPDFAAVRFPFTPDRDFQAKLLKWLNVFVEELDLGEKIVRQLGYFPKDAPSAFPEADAEEAA